MKKNTLTKYLILLILIPCISSCKAKKKSIDGSSLLLEFSDDQIKEKIKEANIKYDYLELSGVAQVESPEISISGNFICRIKHNEVAWLRVQKFGFEAVRMIIQNDSVTVLNRLEKTFTKAAIQDASDLTNLSLDQNEMIEMLAGNILLDGGEFKSVEQDSFVYEYKTAFDDYILSVDYDAIGEYNSRTSFTDLSSRSVSIDYSQFNMLDSTQMYATIRDYLMLDEKGVPRSLRLTIKEAKINEMLTFPFDIPSHYTQADF